MYMYKTLKTPLQQYVYDGNKNLILNINQDEYNALFRIEHSNEGEGDKIVLKNFQDRGFCLPTNVEEIIHPDLTNLKYYFDSILGKLFLQVTQNCNLHCDYCPYSGKYENRAHSNKVMSYELAIKTIDYFMKHSMNAYQTNLGFYGGEPLLEFNLIKRVVQYIKEKYPAKNISYTITTNGTILTEEIMEFLSENLFDLSISLDGHKECQDANRVFLNGKGSFETVMKNLNALKMKYPNYYSQVMINSIVSPGVDFRCVEEFFVSDDAVKDLSVMSSPLSDNYIKDMVFYDDEYFKVQLYESFKVMLWSIGKIDKSKVSKLFSGWRGTTTERYRWLQQLGDIPKCYHPGGPCVPGKNRLFITTDGDFYPCEKVSENSEVMKIGTIHTGIDFKKVEAIINIAEITKEECKNCWCFSFCGLCAVTADTLTDKFSKEKRLELCSDVKIAVYNEFLDICFLKEHSFNFEENVISLE